MGVVGDLQMEHGFLKAPWEVLIRNFRAGHKPLAKELELFSAAVSQLVQDVSANPCLQPVSSLQPANIDALEKKLTGLKRKLETTRAKDEDSMRRCYLRITHLCSKVPSQLIPSHAKLSTPPPAPSQKMDIAMHRSVDSPSTPSTPDASGDDMSNVSSVPKVDNDEAAELLRVGKAKEMESCWEKLRLDRALVHFMLREGMYETAEKLAKSQGIEELVDMEIFQDSRVVIEGLRKRDCSEALRWCAENKRRLQKFQSKLEFRLRLQEFVEHARAGRKTDAILYMQKFLLAFNCDSDRDRLIEVQRFMALLIFEPSTSCQPYKDMYSERNWIELENAFKQDNYSLHGLTRESTVEIMLKAGLATLKTRKCGTEAERKPNCPSCVEPYLSLAQSLPRGRHDNSTLVCSISGQIMDENNPPMALPNGNVYSRNALTKLSEDGHGIIIDPKNQDTTRLDELRKCFIM